MNFRSLGDMAKGTEDGSEVVVRQSWPECAPNNRTLQEMPMRLSSAIRIPTTTTEVPIMKYKLILNNCFHSERTEYEPGEPVKAVFQWLATDTSYQFFIDADDVRQECVNDSMVFRFTMPNHDVEMSFTSRNTMVYDPRALPDMMGMGPFHGMKRDGEPAHEDEIPLSEGEWVCGCCRSRNRGKFCSECGNQRPS